MEDLGKSGMNCTVPHHFLAVSFIIGSVSISRQHFSDMTGSFHVSISITIN